MIGSALTFGLFDRGVKGGAAALRVRVGPEVEGSGLIDRLGEAPANAYFDRSGQGLTEEASELPVDRVVRRKDV